MTDTTDHRAEAEKWLDAARTHMNTGDYDDPQAVAQSAALIGIGHALLAGPPERTVTVNAPNYGSTGEELKEALVRMARQGQLGVTLRRADNQPSPSPSEG